MMGRDVSGYEEWAGAAAMGERDQTAFSGAADESLPVKATLEMTFEYGRYLAGWPLAVVSAIRNLVIDLLTGGWFMGNAADDDLGPPLFMILEDQTTGRRVARVGLGRDDVRSHGRRVEMEYDFDRLSRQEFIAKHAQRASTRSRPSSAG